MLVYSDIVNLDKEFYDRTVSTGKIIFGLHRTNLMKVSIHWDQDFKRIIRIPSLIRIRNYDAFLTAIEASRQRASTSKHIPEESASISKVSDPG